MLSLISSIPLPIYFTGLACYSNLPSTGTDMAFRIDYPSGVEGILASFVRTADHMEAKNRSVHTYFAQILEAQLIKSLSEFSDVYKTQASS